MDEYLVFWSKVGFVFHPLCKCTRRRKVPQVSWQRGRIICRRSHCNNQKYISEDDQQEAASLGAANPLSLTKIFLVYIYLNFMLISGRTIPEASANLLLKAGHYAVAGDTNKDYKAFKKAKPE